MEYVGEACFHRPHTKMSRRRKADQRFIHALLYVRATAFITGEFFGQL
jgi:hypothetical protein